MHVRVRLRILSKNSNRANKTQLHMMITINMRSQSAVNPMIDTPSKTYEAS